jgi:flagellar biosynthetic protein FliP
MRNAKAVIVCLFGLAALLAVAGPAGAKPAREQPVATLTLKPGTPGQVELPVTIQLAIALTLLTLAPAFLILLTSFTRIVIVLAFLRSAIGVSQIPPNQVLIGLALFLTFFSMAPTLERVNKEAVQPYMAGQGDFKGAVNSGLKPLREFMFRQAGEKDLALFLRLSGEPRPKTPDDLPTYVLVPAFSISELKRAFEIGFLVYLPFLVIDLVVASVLMSMGMLMLPPVMVSLPFKVLLFVLVDGWRLVTESLLLTFH